MSNGVCFLDTETTGLHPDNHQIWEVALITPDGHEHVWQFPVDEMAADPFALDIGHYWDRKWDPQVGEVSELDAIYSAHKREGRRKNYPTEGRAINPSVAWCRHFRGLTSGLHLCGAVPSFDEERLRRLLNRNGVLHRWHYHLIDIEALAVGYLHGAKSERGTLGTQVLQQGLPWRSDDLSRACGIEPPNGQDKHTALGDARWAKAIYEAVTDGGDERSADGDA